MGTSYARELKVFFSKKLIQSYINHDKIPAKNIYFHYWNNINVLSLYFYDEKAGILYSKSRGFLSEIGTISDANRSGLCELINDSIDKYDDKTLKKDYYSIEEIYKAYYKIENLWKEEKIKDELEKEKRELANQVVEKNNCVIEALKNGRLNEMTLAGDLDPDKNININCNSTLIAYLINNYNVELYEEQEKINELLDMKSKIQDYCMHDIILNLGHQDLSWGCKDTFVCAFCGEDMQDDIEIPDYDCNIINVFDWEHIRRMTDNTGNIMQFAISNFIKNNPEMTINELREYIVRYYKKIGDSFYNSMNDSKNVLTLKRRFIPRKGNLNHMY